MLEIEENLGHQVARSDIAHQCDLQQLHDPYWPMTALQIYDLPARHAQKARQLAVRQIRVGSKGFDGLENGGFPTSQLLLYFPFPFNR
jgi:hypothetical protein